MSWGHDEILCTTSRKRFPAAARAVHDPLPFVLRMAPRGRLRVPRRTTPIARCCRGCRNSIPTICIRRIPTARARRICSRTTKTCMAKYLPARRSSSEAAPLKPISSSRLRADARWSSRYGATRSSPSRSACARFLRSQLAALRFLVAAVPLASSSAGRTMPLAIRRSAYGFAIGVCQFGLLFLGMKLGMPAGLSSLVIQVQVFFTIGLGVTYLGDRHFAPERDRRGASRPPAVVLLAAYKVDRRRDGNAAGFVLVLARGAGMGCRQRHRRRRARPAITSADMFALVVWSSLGPRCRSRALSYSVRRRRRGVAVRRPRQRARVGAACCSWPGARTLFGFCVVAGLMHRYPTGLISPFAPADPGVGTRRAARCSWTSRSAAMADRRRGAGRSRAWP